jgi:hypothetical protein
MSYAILVSVFQPVSDSIKKKVEEISLKSLLGKEDVTGCTSAASRGGKI